MRLHAEALACQRGGRTVFRDLSFQAEAGEALQVVGRNGAGKSSLLRMIAGLVPVAAGAIRLDGGDPEASIGEQAHYCGHQDAFKPALTVKENLAFWTAFLGGPATGDDLLAALARLGLDHLADLPAGYLSAGQRRRLALARLVSIARPLWLLDEPTAALDQASQQVLASLMAAHLAGGGLILAATHGPLGIAARALVVGPAP
ncbi:heme ABC exporter ATP-binding protein CcmA [Phreatobacter sp. AB_2022a]|uniref:heme ABC exporter ATP-binding protein CcmA n=1 Tax=Phreatobacter sp. AB_2022a TaxID=3003134 RepID=UPI002286D967|nr:heme ABC exporter ATP-binding protein CcmA [Phreatobacter sp. AB_2022a]MCZ0734748.1 heme ABC exporter ATP-binding protein CcmA [Phreatobacter sp. AB_2022a]